MPVTISRNTVTTERNTCRPWCVNSAEGESKLWSETWEQLRYALATFLTQCVPSENELLGDPKPTAGPEETSIQQTQIDSLMTFISETLGDVDGLDAIYMSIDKRDVDVWIVTRDYDFDRNDRIYERRTAIFDAFADVALDFRIVPRDGRADHDLVPAGSQRIVLAQYALC